MSVFGIPERDLLQFLVFFVLLVGASVPLGAYLARIYEGVIPRWVAPLRILEEKLRRWGGVCGEEMDWKKYTASLLAFNAVGFAGLWCLLSFQSHLPLNPQSLPDVPGWLGFNTAMSFVTNTNWQAYSGESTLSYFSQMVGLSVQNFVSAATGMAVVVALARGLSRKMTSDLGNFWVDLIRGVVYVLLPLAFVLAIVLAGQGVVQSFGSYVTAHTLEGASQIIPMGPAASQIAIKQLGTNGGGFFGVNSAHPFENPTAISNFLQLLSILLLPAAMVHMFGRLVGDKKQGWAIFNAMLILLVLGLGVALVAEYHGNPSLGGLPYLEGKEVRFGIGNSVLWEVSTTAASNGSVNAMHDSFSPLAGLVALVNMQLGEVIFGGVGAGLYGMLMFVLIAVFIAGLMVGRTPEYLGKKIEAREIVSAAIAVLVPSLFILGFSALAVKTQAGLSSLSNGGPHGLSEILYTFSSALGNNGSAFGGLNANTNFYNGLTGFGMLIGRFVVIIPALAIAGSLARKKKIPASLGTFPTGGGLFTGLLVAVVLIVGALTFFPSLVLGPIVEHLLMGSGKLF